MDFSFRIKFKNSAVYPYTVMIPLLLLRFTLLISSHKFEDNLVLKLCHNFADRTVIKLLFNGTSSTFKFYDNERSIRKRFRY